MTDKPTYEELENRNKELEFENFNLKTQRIEISKAKELYLKIFEDFPALIWRSGLDKLCDYFNNTWLEFTGRTMEQEIGNGWTEGVHPEDFNSCLQIYATAFDKREAFLMEYRLKNKLGVYRWISDYGRPFCDIDNTFLGYIGSCYDITESKEKTEETEKRFEAFTNQSTDGITVADMDGNYVFVNPAFCQMSGYSQEELLKMSVYDMRNKTHSHDHFVDSKREKQGLKFEINLIRKDKTEYFTEIFGKVITINNKNFVLGTIRDITERRQTELRLKKLQTAIESSKACIVITDFEGNIEYANPFFTENTGYISNEYLGKNPRILKTDLHNNTYYINFWDTIKSGKTWEGEFCNRKKNGELYWEKAIVSPINNNKNEITHFVAIKYDITENKKITKDLIIAKEKAEESEKLKTAFLQNMSHEIRTPLNAISGFSGILNKPDLSEEKRKSFISIIQNSSNQLISIVSDILTISSLETKQEKININKVCINNIIVDLLAIFKQQATNQNISLYAKQQLSDKQSDIYTDKTKITQILSNLLTNSLKFTHVGFIEFGYNLKENKLEFYVKDSGIGIKPEFHEKIFERFRQADKSIQMNYGGTGLGLSISKGFVKLLGGKIWVQSELEKGSTFYFTIPYKPVNEIDKTTTPTKQNENFRTVLVAEDEEYNFLFIEELLIDMDLKLIHAKDGRETVEIFKSNPNIALILMDIKMPIMTGHEAAKIIKELKPDLPIVAQSAYALENERAKYEGIFDDYLTKPIDEDNLKQMVMKYIDIQKE